MYNTTPALLLENLLLLANQVRASFAIHSKFSEEKAHVGRLQMNQANWVRKFRIGLVVS